MDNIIHKRFCRLPFGIISSPFILTATLRYHVAQHAPELMSKIVYKCYVYNFVKEENVKEPQSKRKVLSAIASMYDPCGLCAPLNQSAKLLLQQLWETKMKWDAVLPDELQGKWEDIIHCLEAIKEIKVPRFIGLTGETAYELHVFSHQSKFTLQ